MFRCDLVTFGDLASNISGSLATFQPAPDNHCRFVERVVALRIQVHQHCLAAVEFGVDNVTVWVRSSRCRQAILLTSSNGLVAGRGRCNDHGKGSRTSGVCSCLRVAPGNLAKAL